MARPKKESLQSLFKKAVDLLESGAPLSTVNPLLRDTTEEVTKLYGKHPGPQLRLRKDPHTDDWHLWTTVPSADWTHEASWGHNEQLKPEEEAELRKHMIDILNAWLAQDALFSEPMAKSDLAKRFDVDVRTIYEWIVEGQLSVIEVNRNFVRVLKTQLPPKIEQPAKE